MRPSLYVWTAYFVYLTVMQVASSGLTQRW
jgi:hypothetical protein